MVLPMPMPKMNMYKAGRVRPVVVPIVANPIAATTIIVVPTMG